MTDPTPTDGGYAPPPSQHAPPAGRPPLRRDNEAGFLGGVAAGVANHLGVDVVLIRIGFVVVTVFTQGLGALAYLLCWAFIPTADEYQPGGAASQRSDVSAESRGGGFWAGVVLLTIGILWFLTSFRLPVALPFGFIDAGLVMPLLLIGLGVALWRGGGGPNGGGAYRGPNGGSTYGDGGTGGQSSPPPAPTGAPVASSPWTPPAGAPPSAPGQPADRPDLRDPSDAAAFAPASSDHPDPSDHPDRHGGVSTPPETPMAPTSSTSVIDAPTAHDAGDGPPPPPPVGGSDPGGFTPPPVPTTPRSILTRLTLGLALLAVGVLWIVEFTTGLSIGPVMVLAIGLAIIGAGLLIGSVLGRGRGLIIAGLLLAPLVLLGGILGGYPAGQLIESAIRGDVSVGQIEERVEDEADLSELYQVGAGTLVLDLSDLELTEDREVTVRVGAGELDVIVPDDVTVEVSASLSGGELQVLGMRRTGLGLSLSQSEPPVVPDASAPTLSLEVEVAFGDVTVRR